MWHREWRWSMHNGEWRRAVCQSGICGADGLCQSYGGPTATTFSNANVCPAGQTTPAPCSQTVTLNYSVGADTTFGNTNVLTQGFPNLDFSLAKGSTCSGTVSAGSSCSVNVTICANRCRRAYRRNTTTRQVGQPGGRYSASGYRPRAGDYFRTRRAERTHCQRGRPGTE